MLVDTSVWVDHLRRRSARLSDLLDTTQVSVHPLVIGELSCGNISRRKEVLGLLEALPHVPLADHEEVLEFVAVHRLYGRGLGWIDINLLASARLARVPIWTLDKRLAVAAQEAGVGSATS